MRILIFMTLLAAMIGLCSLLCITSLYAAAGLAAAQTARVIPFVGDMVSARITAWVLGAKEDHVVEVAPVPPPGPPIDATSMPVTPMPGNPACGKPYTYPVNGAVTSRFGWRTSPFPPFVSEFHAGIDFSAPSGTPVYSTMCGTVTFAGWSDLYGWQVSVTNGNPSTGSGQVITTLYGHNSEILVAEGAWVEVGQLLASSGSTGRSTAPHVHYGISIDGQWVDPETAFGIG